MTIQEYELLTGTTVSTEDIPLITAKIAKTKSMLEQMLGYSLDVQVGPETRQYIYTGKDQYLLFDPFVSITAIQVIRQGALTWDIDQDQYQIINRQGIKKYIQINSNCYSTLNNHFRPNFPINKDYEKPSIIEVTGVFEFATLPDKLLYLWSDMIEHYSNPDRDLESQTLATHSYKKKANYMAPELDRTGRGVLKQLAGGNGSISSINVA